MRNFAQVLADHRLFLLNDEQWDAFMAALDAPSEPMPRLERLFSEASVLNVKS
jgi:uncharacterized protein (DUF1778 family)